MKLKCEAWVKLKYCCRNDNILVLKIKFKDPYHPFNWWPVYLECKITEVDILKLGDPSYYRNLKEQFLGSEYLASKALETVKEYFKKKYNLELIIDDLTEALREVGVNHLIFEIYLDYDVKK